MYPVVIVFAVLTVILAASFYLYNVRTNNGTSFSAMIGAVMILGITFAFGFGSTALISSASINGQLEFKEFWNGYESKAEKREVTCNRDGQCRNTYECDSYQVPVTRTNSDGESYIEMETRWHDCPYSKQETSFYITTTLDSSVDYGTNLMTGEEFRFTKAIPGGRQETPKDWIEAVKRLDAGKPWGITEIHKYKNFILSSKSEMYKKYSDSIDKYIEEGVMPEIPSTVHRGVSTKMFVTNSLNLPETFAVDVTNLNGAMAADKRFGDLRVVMVNSSEVPDADNYTNALHTYWSDVKVFGKFALPKNAVVVTMGVNNNGTKVEWARAFTGMPIGNEEMIQGVASALKDAKVDSNLLGRPFIDKEGTVIHSEGVLEKVLWDDVTGFNRVSMSGDEAPSAGFLYLGSDITPTTGAVIWMGVLWGLALAGSVVGAFFASSAIAENSRPRSMYSSRNLYSSRRW